MSLAMHIATYLRRHGIGPTAFAAMIGVSHSAVSRYVTGKKLPAADVIRKIRDATGGAVQPNDVYAAWWGEPDPHLEEAIACETPAPRRGRKPKLKQDDPSPTTIPAAAKPRRSGSRSSTATSRS